MAAPYDIKDPASWSGTPLSLYRALLGSGRADIDTVDLSQNHTKNRVRLNNLKSCDIAASLKAGAYVSKYGLSTMNKLNSKLLSDVFKKRSFDALLEFGGFKHSPGMPPYYIYTDATHDAKLDFYRQYGKMPFNMARESYSDVVKSSQYAGEILLNSAGVFCMSRWLADSLVHTTGADPQNVHVVYAGPNWHCIPLPGKVAPKSLDGRNDIHLLAVGVDYFLKGMDIAVSAVKILNKTGDKKYTLHVAGITDAPAGVFDDACIVSHGFVDKAHLAALLQNSDLLALPTRFDCFGIAFLEAMQMGLPCIGRNICAMPEIIDEGVNGELVTDDDPVKLAELIDKICSDGEGYTNYSAQAIKKSQLFGWDITADKMLDIMGNDFY